ncbi:DNA/RNA helicase domain-containing protein [Leuconostoc mesenteroides]|uniref:DNA/RNA helicase domain-containing protein n=2 Tax=Leuconostoc TaxID=1243 RepID=UPI000E08FACF|nr:DNA/RNA helicase domain-containing protein [Leuconostoc mesenteroides]RDF90307.1 hypothetical protein DQM09_08905 [Leuconostoc mesenteroides subsp. mesenteroides]
MSYVSLKEFIDVKEAGNLSQFLNYKKIFPKITHETDDFYHFAKMFYCTNKHLSDIDGWFLGTDLTVIPDFDILLFLDSFILNIDLKRQITNDDLTNYVSKKFKQQSRIFRVLNKTVYNLVFVVEDNSLYHFDPSTEIFSTYSFEDLFQLILSSNILFENKIEQLTPSEFLINPWKDKDDFIHQRYWLSNTQQKISDSIICSGIYGVTGEAGTGKTLIACDVMRKMSNDKRILFVVPGDVDSEKKDWVSSFKNIEVHSAKEINNLDLEKYQMILVDESQRLFPHTRNRLVVWGNANYVNKTLIFFFHVDQTLSPKDSGVMMKSFIQTSEKDGKGQYFELIDNMRSNEAITYFVRNVFHLSESAPKRITTEDYRNHIDLKYFSSSLDAEKWIKDYIKKGYIFLVPTGDNHKEASSDKFGHIDNTNTHHIIGGEMDNVVTYMDDFIEYSQKGIIESKSREYYYLDHEIYVNLTRARNKLALAIINNPDLYKGIMDIIYKCKPSS